jgi:Phosphodiester glycosidase
LVKDVEMRYSVRRILPWLAVTTLGVIIIVFVGLYAYAGLYGINAVLKRAGTIFLTVTEDDPRISPSMRLALKQPPPEVRAASFDWKELQSGFEVAEMPVIAGLVEVDRFLLARIEPKKFRFEVLVAPAGYKNLDDWIKESKAALIINGSYFSRRGEPDTPLKSRGLQLGPDTYQASHGIFTAKGMDVAVADLLKQPWQDRLRDAEHAMVSYPLLLAPDGSVRVKSDRRWLANRTFVALDKQGRVVIATTKDAFFSLERLGSFLKDSPLDLNVALNLDGGPLGCQAINFSGFERSFCGPWETQTTGDNIKLLRPLIGNAKWGLPIVLAVFPK